MCDSLLARQPGRLTFEINRHRVVSGVCITDEEALDAVRFAFEELKLVLEPSGAVALAAVLTGKLDGANRVTGLILSGGNVDWDIMETIISR